MSTSQSTFHFIPKQSQGHILTSPVTHILAIPHAQEAGTNHWSLYLSTSEHSSVCLDCQPSYSIPSTALQGGSKALLVVSELPYRVPPDAQGHFILDVIPGLTTESILDILKEHGRHKYEFDPNGVGCRYWVTNQLGLLFQLGILIEERQITAAKDGIRMLWPEKTPLPLDQGAYY